ncbi:hypothetical protein PIB30_095577 [Stylosanthes scabra]|uniref:Uncharacterized protein n=1 Tax=Stylosanthes scabra TaxID=79078 RepID=A0ABU6UZC3_9FABA|nr:hypothetical protein [Stylosanthes scabra]
MAPKKRKPRSTHRRRSNHPVGHGLEDYIKLVVPYCSALGELHHQLFGNVNTGLGHGALWTKIFEHLGVDLSGEEAVLVDDKNAITTRHLNKIGRGPKAAAERNEEAGEGSSHPQNVGSSTHFPPEFMESFTQGM